MSRRSSAPAPRSRADGFPQATILAARPVRLEERRLVTDYKLGALTAIHNFHILRPDGTTAAERFFGRAHPPLFEHVLRQVSFPPPPRQRRPRPAKRPYLTPLALAA